MHYPPHHLLGKLERESRRKGREAKREGSEGGEEWDDMRRE